MSITLINAGPGSGKTYTLVYSYMKLSKTLAYPIQPTQEQGDIFEFVCSEFPQKAKVCFFAHNTSTKETLEKRLPGTCDVFTFHGAGLSAIIKRFGHQHYTKNRTERFIADITGQTIQEMKPAMKFSWLAVKKLTNYYKLEGLEPDEESFQYLKLKYPDLGHLSFPPDWKEKVEKLLRLSLIPNGQVEFTDMLYLGLHAVQRPKYDLGFVDESQDVSRASYQLVTRLCKHVLFCGDKNQAINAFAGASEEMYDHIASKSDAILPLKSTLRNPPNIVDLANSIRPGGVIYGPKTEPGKNCTLPYDSLPEKLREEGVTPFNTLIISRTNAAIVSCAISLYSAGVPCRIVDKDLADELTTFVKNFKVSNLSALRQKLDTYEDRAHRSPSPLWAQMCTDKCDQIRAIMSVSKDYKHLFEIIKQTFKKHKDGFKLTSVHKSKGQEAENLFIINPPIELKIAMSHPIGREQEINLAFVGVTRAAKDIYWVK